MKNRTIIGIVCMILAVAMTFAVAPLVNRLTSDTTTVVRLKQEVGRGAKITAEQVETIKVKTDNNETNEIDADEYREALSDFCTLVKSGSRYYNYDSDGETNFYISKPYVGFTEQNKLKIYASYRVYIPIRFAGVWVTTAVVPITVESKFNERF